MTAYLFFVTNVLLGVGLSMDAFSISLANGLNEPEMRKFKHWGIAGCYGFFQFLMPMIGWICVYTIVTYFKSFQKFIPWIALILLLFIGGKMLIEGIQNLKKDPEERNPHILKIKELVFQGVATAIDALSVGFTIANYNLLKAFIASVIIGVVTMVLCLIGVSIGRKVGTKIGDKATIIGGIILIAIGIQIFVTGVF